jgi:hypothetical protein
VQGHQRAGDRPGAQVAVTGVPDQAGFVDIFTGNVEAENGDRHMTAVFIDARQVHGGAGSCAPDAIGVGQDDVEGFDFGMGIKECRSLGRRRAGR